MRARSWTDHGKRTVLGVAVAAAAISAACSSSGGGGNGPSPAPTPPGPDVVEPSVTEPAPQRAEFGLDTRPSNTTCLAPARPPAAGAVKLEQVFANVAVDSPMWMAQPPGDNARWFVAQRDGKIFTFPSVNPPAQPTLVADVAALSGKTIHETFEAGFLGFAFHPDFAQNGRIYVSYSTNADGGGFGSEVGVITSTNAGASFTQYARVLAFPRATLEHNGGGILFGKDGYLYLSFGDEALNGQLGQVKTGFSAKILRIDVDNVPAGKTYGIPPTNPWASGGGEPATYAYGFRNPFRISLDRETGEVWTGDVGQDDWEEVNRVELGGNYGWPCREGTHDVMANDPVKCPTTNGIIDPVIEHQHVPKNSRAIIGGAVYRGPSMPALHGTYFYGDIIQLEARALSFDPVTGAIDDRIINEEGPKTGFTAFCEDADGEIYALATFQNTFFKLVPNAPAQPSTFPDRLSKTGCVDPADAKRPASGVIPFGVNAALWSDGAEKERFLALPDGTQIGVAPSGDFEFPVGTVLLKTFSLGTKRVETRLFVRHDDGDWGGYTYEWNDEQTDATLLPSGKTKTVGAQTWTFPSRSDCMRCHTEAAGRSLGPEIAQLNGDHVYPSTNRIANQLTTLDHIGMFTAPLGKPAAELAAYPAPFGAGPLEGRARAYLHSNCAGCHQPNGGAPRSDMDLRFATPMGDTKACNVAPQLDDLGIAGAKLLAPGSPETSIVSIRAHATDVKRMPPLGRLLVDQQGTGLVDDWIRALTCP